MLVTIFSDAGMCPITNIATWAAWAKSERGVARAGGILKDKCRNSTIAESMAALNGVHMALVNGVCVSGDVILIQSDNNNVGQFLFNYPLPHHKNKDDRIRMKSIADKLKAKFFLQYRFRHVQGHKGTKDKRSAVNTWCDSVCSFFLALGRNEENPVKWPKMPACVPYGVKMDVAA